LPFRKGQAAFLLGIIAMEIHINGHRETCPDGTLAQLVAAKELAPEALVIELNGIIVRQEQWPAIRLKDGDILELLSFVGGG
jgi:sulfur carrier protein